MTRRSRQLLLAAVAGVAIAATAALVVGLRANAADDKKAAVPRQARAERRRHPAAALDDADLDARQRQHRRLAGGEHRHRGERPAPGRGARQRRRRRQARPGAGDLRARHDAGRPARRRAPPSPRPRRRSADAAANAERAQRPAARPARSAKHDQPVRDRRAHRAGAPRRAARGAAGAPAARSARRAVLAPDDGVISARSATVGAVLPAGQELFRLIRQGRLEWRAEVAAADLAQIKPGMRAPPSRRPAARRSPARCAWSRRRSTRRPATASSTSTCRRPAARLAPACSRAASSTSAAASALTLPQSAVLLRDGFSYVFRVGADNKVTQTKVDGRPALGDRIEITGGLDARGARRRHRAAASSPTATWCASSTRRPAMQRDRRVGAASDAARAMINVSSWSIRNPIPGDPAVHHADARRPDGLPGDEDPELPGHRPADGHRHGVAARRVAGAARDRGRAQDRELGRDAAGRQAHLHHGAGRRRRRSRSSSGSRSRRRKRSTTCATRSRASAPTCPADLRDPVIAKIDLAGAPILTYTVASTPHGRRGAVLVRRQHGDKRAARGARRRRGDARRRRRRARCASSSTRRACWR